MFYLKNFNNKADYETYVKRRDSLYPNVSTYNTSEDLEVEYNPVQPYKYQYLTIESLLDGSTFYLFKRASPTINVPVELKYSLDNGKTWYDYAMPANGANGNSITINKGLKILLKGDNRDGFNFFSYNGSTVNNKQLYYILGSGKTKVYGNILSLIHNDNFINDNTMPDNDNNPNFARLFLGNESLIDAENLYINVDSVTQCYAFYIFSSCISLTTAPELPATTLADYCYDGMFWGCTNLTTAPELPATTIAEGCYYTMFYGCSSLTTAPKILPATTLARECYLGMLEGCTNLIIAPELPATTLADHCYCNMFKNCTNLTVAPELPATTLAERCYSYMFLNCTSLTIAPELPAATLANDCYYSMFYCCKSLESINNIIKNIYSLGTAMFVNDSYILINYRKQETIIDLSNITILYDQWILNNNYNVEKLILGRNLLQIGKVGLDVTYNDVWPILCEEVILDPENPYFTMENDIIYSSNGEYFYGNSSYLLEKKYETLTIKEGVKYIVAGSLRNICDDKSNLESLYAEGKMNRHITNDQCILKHIVFPSTTEFIGDRNGQYASLLTDVTILATTPPALPTNFFPTTSIPIYVPAASVNAYKTAWPTYASRIQAIS